MIIRRVFNAIIGISNEIAEAQEEYSEARRALKKTTKRFNSAATELEYRTIRIMHEDEKSSEQLRVLEDLANRG